MRFHRYVPTLAREILDNAPEINIRGVAVGDPCTDNVAQKDSMDMLWYAHKNGFVPEEDYDLLWNKCQSRHPIPLARGVWGEAAAAADAAALKVDPPLTTECLIARRKFLASSSRGFSQGWNNGWINDLSLYGPAALVPFNVREGERGGGMGCGRERQRETGRVRERRRETETDVETETDAEIEI